MAVNIVDSGFGDAEVGDHNTWTFSKCDEFNSNSPTPKSFTDKKRAAMSELSRS